jgi:hypothetical protein
MAVDDSYTKLLLHCNGTNDSQTFIDESGKTVTANGDVKISTTQKKFGNASAYFDGGSDYLSLASNVDFAYGTGAFTVDFWFRLASTGRLHVLYSHGGSNTASPNGGVFTVGADNKIHWFCYGYLINGTLTVTGDEWHHMAIIGNGGSNGSRTVKMYLDGVLDGSVTSNYNFIETAIVFGANQSYYPECIDGWLDEIRVSKGIQRWTSNFTPPTKAYGLQNSSNFFNFF